MSQGSFSFVRYMTQYGIALGCLVGFFGAIALTLTLSNNPIQVLQLMPFALVTGMFGGIVGIFYGAVSGFASGLLMAWLTGLVFQEIKRPTVYKCTMGTTTLIATLAIFLAIPIWNSLNYQARELDPMFAGITNRPLLGIPVEADFSLWIMSLLFAVYASQQVARAYLQNMNVRKSKAK